MATVTNFIKMKDSMGSVLKDIVREMDITMGTMERLNSASDRLNLGGSLNNATSSASALHRGLDPIDGDLRKASEEQKDFNNKIRDGTSAANGLHSTMVKMASVIGVKEIISFSDQITLLSARLDLIKSDMETVADLQAKIFGAASNARGLYSDMAASVSKLALLAGDAFSGNDEIIRFVELYQKMGTIGGSSSSEISNAMYQLNQAMASGRLQGDEYRSIIENAPMLANAIEDYMINVQGAKGSMKDWASEGLLTADVIKAAMFSVADEVDETFAKMPMTWGQVWNGAINKLIIVSEPLLKFINFLANNWTIIEPLAIAAGLAILGYVAALALYKGITFASAAVTAAHTAFTTTWTFATFQATLAQKGLNAALLACPITWILIAIIGLVAIFYAAVAAVNKFTGSTLSATGLIMGAIFVLGAYIYNQFILPTWNVVAMLVNFFANVWNDPIGAVKLGFFSLATDVVGYILWMANAIESVINKIPGVEVDITSGLDSFYSQMETAADKAKNQFEWVDYVGTLDSIGYGDAWNKGYGLGSNIQDKVTGAFGSSYNTDDLASSLADQEYDVNVKDDVNLADESLEYLLDAVMQKYVNNVNVTSPAPTVQVTFAGDINRDVDLDELAEKTKKKIGTEIVEFAMSSTDIKR